MAGPWWIEYIADNDPGERFAPEVIAEIILIAPSTVNDGDITTAKLDDKAVTEPKIDDEALIARHFSAQAVETVALKNDAVTNSKLADNAVEPANCGTGVVTAEAFAGSALENAEVFCTQTEYNGITPNANKTYYCS